MPRHPAAPRSLAIISTGAHSLLNFRGPLILALVRAGVRVFALAPDYDEQLRARIVALGAEPIDWRVDRTSLNPAGELRDMLALAKTLRRLRPDAVLGYFLKPIVLGMLAASLARVPRRYALVEGLGYAFTGDGEARAGLKRRVLRATLGRALKAAFGRATKVMVLNPDDLDEIVSRGFVPREKTVLLGAIGVNLTDFPVPPLPEGGPHFLMIGRLLREKGVREYAAAARIVKTACPEARIVLVGGTDVNPGAIPVAEVEGWAREGLLEWAGEVADVRPFIAAANVYVLPSWREGLPRSTQEAMAMGRAVITTDVPGCRHTVEDGVNGYLVPVRDPEALAAAMLRFAGRADLMATMGQASRTMAEARYDVDKVNARILGLLGLPEAGA